MTGLQKDVTPKTAEAAGSLEVQTYFFSELVKRRIFAGKVTSRLGRMTDLVFHMGEPFPEAVGIYIENGWGKPTEFIPWSKVIKIAHDGIFVQPPDGGQYPPYVSQPGWLMVNENLMGQTILDLYGRRTEVVNDVHLLETEGHLFIVHVDISFNGFLRRLHQEWLARAKNRLISWKVRPTAIR